jgi:1-acyl-sn-glycerol-3-phosphate acyltransferase
MADDCSMPGIVSGGQRSPRARRKAVPIDAGGQLVDFQERLQRLGRNLGAALEESGGAEPAKREGLVTALTRLMRETKLDQLLGALESVRASERTDDFGLDPEFEELVAPFFEFLYERWWRVETRGLDRVPSSGAAIIVANHSGAVFPWDGTMLKVALKRFHPAKRELRALIENFVTALPFAASMLARCGAVRACPENALRLLARGEVIAVFPEGLRGMSKPFERRYHLERFGRGGFVSVAAESGAPIVPAAIVGAEEIHPLLGKLERPARWVGLPYLPITPTFPWFGAFGLIPLPTKWTITFGEPIDVAARFSGKRPFDPIMIDRTTEEVRGTVQRMLDRSLGRRRSVFF